MKKLWSPLLLLLILAACTSAGRNERQAELYAERLESGETVAAQEYSDMVEFYCAGLDNILAEIEPAAKKHAAALDSGNEELAKKTGAELNAATAKASENHKSVVHLGTQLHQHMWQLPDSSRQRLVQHIMDVSLRYANF